MLFFIILLLFNNFSYMGNFIWFNCLFR